MTFCGGQNVLPPPLAALGASTGSRSRPCFRAEIARQTFFGSRTMMGGRQWGGQQLQDDEERRQALILATGPSPDQKAVNHRETPSRSLPRLGASASEPSVGSSNNTFDLRMKTNPRAFGPAPLLNLPSPSLDKRISTLQKHLDAARIEAEQLKQAAMQYSGSKERIELRRGQVLLDMGNLEEELALHIAERERREREGDIKAVQPRYLFETKGGKREPLYGGGSFMPTNARHIQGPGSPVSHVETKVSHVEAKAYTSCQPDVGASPSLAISPRSDAVPFYNTINSSSVRSPKGSVRFALSSDHMSFPPGQMVHKHDTSSSRSGFRFDARPTKITERIVQSHSPPRFAGINSHGVLG
eukprot:TRINITY_DN9099_c1_g4_i2.p1 TRINITY_DN9099_c1_g4~~TRINITY_DN9099_c1_g4_i2.p1  ORF type:complete len:386 (+),score=46.05 TRINITY_DN9099_c1_g4_i2:89-1159(+)